jgi:hypothetical protein
MKNKTIQILAYGDHILPIGTKIKSYREGKFLDEWEQGDGAERLIVCMRDGFVYEVDFDDLPPLYPTKGMEVPEEGIEFTDGRKLLLVGEFGIAGKMTYGDPFAVEWGVIENRGLNKYELKRTLPKTINVCADGCFKKVCECVPEIDKRVDEILKHITIGVRNTLTYIDGTGYSLEYSSAILDGYSGEYKKMYLNIFQENGENKRVKATTGDFDVIQGKIVDCKLGDLFVLNDSDLTKITFPEGILIIGFRDETYVNTNYLFGNCVCYTKYGFSGHEGIILRRKNG